MSTLYQYRFIRSSIVVSVTFLALTLVSCSGYQSVSYYGDGIYGDDAVRQPQQATVNNSTATPQQGNGAYYKNYFADKASKGIQDDYIFTDAEQYQEASPQQTSAGNYQAHGSWGDQVDNINVNVIYNRSFGWNGFYAPFNYGRASFWGYNYHPWYFTFNHHPFYNPYRWGYQNPYYNPYWNNWGYNPYGRRGWGNSYYNQNAYNRPQYSRLNGGRNLPKPNLVNRSANANNRQSQVNTNSRTQRRTNTQGTTTTRSATRSVRRQYNDTSGGNQTNTPQVRQNNNNNNTSYRSSNSSSNSSYGNSSSTSSSRRTAPSTSRSSSSRSSSGGSRSSSRTSSSRRR